MSSPLRTGEFEVRQGVIAPTLIDDALRRLHGDLLERGASAEQLGRWLWGAHWFPHLNYDPAILALAEALPDEWQRGTRCDPQILLQFPHVGVEPAITFHIDREPDWAAGRRYLRIVGIPLTAWREANGGLLIERDGQPMAVALDPGDAIAMAPDVPHSGGINRTGSLRYGVYFRWLEEAAEAGAEVG